MIFDRVDDDFFVGCTEFDSSEFDGEVMISKKVALNEGQFYQVKITRSEEFDLYGKVVLE